MLKKNISNQSKVYRSSSNGKVVAASALRNTRASSQMQAKTVNRSTTSGKFVTETFAQLHPRTTEKQVVESESRRSKLSAVRQKNNEKFHSTYVFLADH